MDRERVVPDAWVGRVRQMHADLGGSWSPAANEWLFEVTERMAGIRLPAALTDAEICAKAIDCAREAMNLADGPAIIDLPALRARLDAFVRSYGINPPAPLRMATKGRKVGQMIGITDAGAVRRMTDAQWWRRALRRSQARAIEREAIALGYVHRRGEIYASDVTVERRAQQKRRNAATLADTKAENLDTGEIYTLAELAARANSNPVIRRGELMTRIAGFEAMAQGLDHAADFWTLTAPSKYHCKRVSGEENEKYEGVTPRETQSYMTRAWAKCRAALQRRGLAVYGFRIAEPHHDGTPHWHCLFFMARAAVKEVRRVVRDYFLREDGDEPGAAKNRVKFVEIDPTIGTAAGYIAKYVAKNIDGFQVQGDFEGENLSAVTGAQRVEAWASTWGIRQFQQIGGAPVGVWRELRRIRKENPEHSAPMAAARAAADAGNWRRYTEVMGMRKSVVGWKIERREAGRWAKPSKNGVTRMLPSRVKLVPIKAWPVSLAYTKPGQRWNFKEGDIQPGPSHDGTWLDRYGEPAAPQVFGVFDLAARRSFQSQRYSWEIRRANRGKAGAIQAAPGECREGVEPRGCIAEGAEQIAGGLQGLHLRQENGVGGVGVGVGFGVPRTRVNNCTQEGEGNGMALRNGGGGGDDPGGGLCRREHQGGEDGAGDDGEPGHSGGEGRC